MPALSINVVTLNADLSAIGEDSAKSEIASGYALRGGGRVRPYRIVSALGA